MSSACVCHMIHVTCWYCEAIMAQAEIERLKEGWQVMSQVPMSAHPSEIRRFANKMLKGEKPYELNS